MPAKPRRVKPPATLAFWIFVAVANKHATRFKPYQNAPFLLVFTTRAKVYGPVLDQANRESTPVRLVVSIVVVVQSRQAAAVQQLPAIMTLNGWKNKLGPGFVQQ